MVEVRTTTSYAAMKQKVCAALRIANSNAVDIVVVDANDGLVLGELAASALTPHETDVQIALEKLNVKYLLRQSSATPESVPTLDVSTAKTPRSSASRTPRSPRSPRSPTRSPRSHHLSPRSPRHHHHRSGSRTPRGTSSSGGGAGASGSRVLRRSSTRELAASAAPATAAGAAAAAAANHLPFNLDEMLSPEELAAYDEAHATDDNSAVRSRSNAFYDNKAPTSAASLAAVAAAAASLTSAPEKLPEKSSSGRGTMYNGLLSSEGVSEEVLSSTDPELLRVGYAHTIGRRASMEDAISIVGRFADDPTRAFVAVFDGHNGHACAQLGARHLHTLVREQFEEEPPKVSLRAAHEQLSQMMSDAQMQGGACVVSIFCVDELLFVANCGDCRCVAVRGAKVTRITRDHTPSLPDEQRRVERLGGRIDTQVMPDGKVVARVQGRLGVSRSLGDRELHPYVIAEPDVFGPFNVRRDFDLCVLACDGVWDVITDADAIAIVRPLRHDPERAAIALRDAAFRAGSIDNISVVVVVFPLGLGRQRSRTVVDDDQTSSSDPFNELALFNGSDKRRQRRRHRHRRK